MDGEVEEMKYYNAKEFLLKKVEELQPMLKYDEKQDFRIWKEEAKGKLEELLGLPFETCEDEFYIKERDVTEEYEKIEFEFQSEENYYIPCTMLVPLEIKSTLPAVICLQGHSTGKHISLGQPIYSRDVKSIPGRDFAIQAVKAGYIAIAMDQRYMGMTEHDEEGNPGCIMNNSALAAAMIGRTAIGERVWDIQRLIDVLESHFANVVNLKRILCLGNSGGGTATFYAASLDERIYMAIASCGVCTYEESIMSISHCSCNHIPIIRRYFEMGDIGGLIAPRKLLMVSGAEDVIFPVQGAKKCFATIKDIYQSQGYGENCMMRIGNGGHQFYPDIVWGIVAEEIRKDEENDRQ